jgi:hypothetical protein
VDERELAELFREAARAIPPASFDVHDVRRAARRATARRRAAVAGSTLAAAAALAGGIGVGTGLLGRPSEPQAVAPQNSSQVSVPSVRINEQLGGPTVLVTPGSCGPPDPVLASALADQLPAAAGMSPVTARSGCPPGARNAAFLLRDGATAGEVMVVLVPAEQASPTAEGESRSADGTRRVTSRARSGQVLTVLSNPDSGSPDAPFAARLAAIAGDLAPRF